MRQRFWPRPARNTEGPYWKTRDETSGVAGSRRRDTITVERSGRRSKTVENASGHSRRVVSFYRKSSRKGAKAMVDVNSRELSARIRGAAFPDDPPVDFPIVMHECDECRPH